MKSYMKEKCWDEHFFIYILYCVMYSIICKEASMDIQLKRGSLDICVLAALLREDSYGYKIVQSLKDVVDISESTLYPILRRLENAGALTSYSVEHNGRLRKFYSITETGKDRIREYLVDFKELLKVYEYIAREVKKDVV